jgi:hypothetical protein
MLLPAVPLELSCMLGAGLREVHAVRVIISSGSVKMLRNGRVRSNVWSDLHMQGYESK